MVLYILPPVILFFGEGLIATRVSFWYVELLFLFLQASLENIKSGLN